MHGTSVMDSIMHISLAMSSFEIVSLISPSIKLGLQSLRHRLSTMAPLYLPAMLHDGHHFLRRSVMVVLQEFGFVSHYRRWTLPLKWIIIERDHHPSRIRYPHQVSWHLLMCHCYECCVVLVNISVKAAYFIHISRCPHEFRWGPAQGTSTYIGSMMACQWPHDIIRVGILEYIDSYFVWTLLSLNMWWLRNEVTVQVCSCLLLDVCGTVPLHYMVTLT